MSTPSTVVPLGTSEWFISRPEPTAAAGDHAAADQAQLVAPFFFGARVAVGLAAHGSGASRERVGPDSVGGPA